MFWLRVGLQMKNQILNNMRYLIKLYNDVVIKRINEEIK